MVSFALLLNAAIVVTVWAAGLLLLVLGWQRARICPPRRIGQPLNATLLMSGLISLGTAWWALPVHTWAQLCYPLILMVAGLGVVWYARPPVRRIREWRAVIMLVVACLVVWPLQVQTAQYARRQATADQAAAQTEHRRLVAAADFGVYVPADQSLILSSSFYEATDGQAHYRLAAKLDNDELFTVAMEQYNPAHSPYSTNGPCGLWAAYTRGDCRHINTTPGGLPVYGEFLYTDQPLYVFVTIGNTRLWIENWRWLNHQKMLALLDTFQPVSASVAPQVNGN